MRKTSYVVAFFTVAISLVFNVIAARRTDWLIVKSQNNTLRYGLDQLCGYNVAGSGDNVYECRKFPRSVQDSCGSENSSFCAAWTSAGYAVELATGFAALSLFAILVGVSTGSRRRRIWKAVAGLVAFQAIFELIAFVIVTETNRTGAFPTFSNAKPGSAYILGTFSWIFSVIIVAAVVTTGVSADKGHRWAAGNRAYRRIDD